ncbi:MAG: NTP transferase domain-containing protein [Nocardioides sp.]|uniref:cytidylyltransferase domain-containing protein n=1 Tax=Nocardioides sp. TaxID=35761 RepID=UPI0039E2AAED
MSAPDPGVLIVTQARMTSTRLPGKVLRPAAGATMLEHHLSRLAASGLPVVVATTTHRTDDPIVSVAERCRVVVVRGSEDDVLGRYGLAVREHRPHTVVRVTSDCPLIDGAVVRAGVEAYLRVGDPELYASNTLSRTYPRGLDFEVFSAAALLEADAAATEPAHREHVTGWLYDDPDRPKLNLPWHRDASAYRLTLDVADDLRLLRLLIEEHDALRLDAAGLVDLLDARPDLAALNAHVAQKAG